MIRAIARARGLGALAACFIALSLSGTARAGEVADAAAQAERLLAEGKTRDAVAAFDGAADAFWAALPLTLLTASFADEIRSLGDYTPREQARFRSGEVALIYLEPAGFAWTADGDGFRVNLEADVEVKSGKGVVFAKAEKFASFSRTSRYKSRELDLRVRMALPALKPGDYELLLTLRDTASGKATSASLPFTLVE